MFAYDLRYSEYYKYFQTLSRWEKFTDIFGKNPFFWFFPAKKIICTFHAAGDITAPRDYFVISREVYNFIIKGYAFQNKL